MPSLPIVFTTSEDSNFIKDLEQRICQTDNSDYLLSYPTVYIHYWVEKKVSYQDAKGNQHSHFLYDVYVGESNSIVSRTRQHYSDAINPNNWQHQLVKSCHNGRPPKFIVIGNKHFNKSLTLDLENRLIEYIMSVNHLHKIHNGRGNPQNKYYPKDEFDAIFKQIWKRLQGCQSDLFSPESVIFDSAIFKASPLKELTAAQRKAKEQIIEKVLDAVNQRKSGQLVFVQGEAGTGKTVLTTSTFYELIRQIEKVGDRKVDCYLLVNHDQQLGVYEQIAKRLDLGEGVVSKPTHFINTHSPSHKVDVCFIDEGHLLLTQGKMGYRGKNQLEDIMARSLVTVIMFDEYQVLTTEEYWETSILNRFKSLSVQQSNYITLDDQLRMRCAASTGEWLRQFIFDRKIGLFERDEKGYELRSFASPAELYDEIKLKANNLDTALSRMVASYDWPYSSKNRPGNARYWGVQIGEWFLPWNYETERDLSRKEKKAIKNLAWAEQEHTIGEVGSTFTIQGFDLSYVGVILGPSVQYRNGRIVFVPKESKNDKAIRNRTLSDHSVRSFGETFIRNEVKVLMTRGVKGLYIYACDDALRMALKQIAKI